VGSNPTTPALREKVRHPDSSGHSWVFTP
jgi:hypothetical protein